MYEQDVMRERVKAAKAIAIATRYGMTSGVHHKQWVIDQMLRVLLGSDYGDWVSEYNSDPEYDDWDVGIAP